MRPFFAATYVFVVWSFTRLITRLERGFLPQFWWGAALSSNVFTICAVYRSLGRRGYFGVSNVVLVFIPLWVWLGTLKDCHHAQCPLPLSIVIRMRLVIRQSKLPSMPCRGAAGPCKHSLAFMQQDWWIWQIKWMKSVSMGSYQYKNQVNGEGFFKYLWVISLYLSLESRLIPAVLGLGQVRLFWKLRRSRIWQLWHSCQTRVWEHFPNSLTLNSEDEMLILGQNDIFCGHNVVNVIFPTDSFQILGC